MSVWCGMINNMFIGPIILDNHKTGHNYLDFLQNELPEHLEAVPVATLVAMYFQHNRAPCDATSQLHFP
jgi:hypothetical protein